MHGPSLTANRNQNTPQEPTQVPQTLGKRLLNVPGQSRPWSCRGRTQTGLLSPPTEAPAAQGTGALGRLGENLGTSSALDSPRQDKASAPSDRAAAAGPSPAPGPGFIPLSGPSSQVLAAFSSAGGGQLTAQAPANHPPAPQHTHTQAWPFLRQHTRGPGPWTHSDVMACLPPPLPGPWLLGRPYMGKLL